jgi:hypothetical protein
MLRKLCGGWGQSFNDMWFGSDAQQREWARAKMREGDVGLALTALIYAVAVIISWEYAMYARLWLAFGCAMALFRADRAVRNDEDTTVFRELYFAVILPGRPLLWTLVFPFVGLIGSRSLRHDYGSAIADYERMASCHIHHDTAREIGEGSANRAAARADEMARRAHEVTVEAPLATGRIGLLLAMLTGTASSASAQDEHKVTAPYSQVGKPAPAPRNAFSFTAEAVNRYHGQQVGEIFAPDPAPRILARYTRATEVGKFYFDGWSSFGSGFNLELDAALGYQGDGWDLSATHFFIRGGDIFQFAVAKSFKVREASLDAALFHYLGTRPSSPPGGTVFKIGSGFSHPAGPVAVSHRFSLGVDDNPFGLGEGISAIAFYNVEAAWKRLYAGWNASVPLFGRDNTTRGFRESFSFGYRHAIVW